MTDKEIWTLAGRYGEWLNGEVVQITDENLIKFVRAVQQAEREACRQIAFDLTDKDMQAVDVLVAIEARE